jgi:hypothetical protein
MTGPSDPFDPANLQLDGFEFPSGKIEEVRTELPSIKAKRDRQFMPSVPERIFCRIARLPGNALAVYLVLSLRCRLKRSRQVELSSCFLARFGLTRKDKERALPALEKAGVIRIVERRHNKNPVIELVDAPKDDMEGSGGGTRVAERGEPAGDRPGECDASVER